MIRSFDDACPKSMDDRRSTETLEPCCSAVWPSSAAVHQWSMYSMYVLYHVYVLAMAGRRERVCVCVLGLRLWAWQENAISLFFPISNLTQSHRHSLSIYAFCRTYILCIFAVGLDSSLLAGWLNKPGFFPVRPFPPARICTQLKTMITYFRLGINIMKKYGLIKITSSWGLLAAFI